MAKRKQPIASRYLSWMQRRCHTWSGWQINSATRAVLVSVNTIVAFAFSFTFAQACLVAYVNKTPDSLVSHLFAWFMELLLIAVCSLVYKALYYQAYELKEMPINESPDREEHGTKWEEFYKYSGSSEDPCDDSHDALRREALYYSYEFFVNALINPRSVFSRINEHVRPDPKVLDCYTDYEIRPPSKRGLKIYGINDYATRAGQGTSCFLTVPVSFTHREDVAMQQDVTNAGDVRLPRVKQSEVSDLILQIIERFTFSNGKTISACEEWEGSLREAVADYLNNTHCNETTSVAHQLFEAIDGVCSDTVQDRLFAERMAYLIAGLRSVVPVCVSLHAVASPDIGSPFACASDSGSASSQEQPAEEIPARVFTLRYAQTLETARKPGDLIPNTPQASHLKTLVNRIVSALGQRNNTVYYSLARAGRAESYHLYLEGPEGTYYSRGSLILDTKVGRIPPPVATYVAMQKRCGQRNAHVYIQSGHRMSNVLFMFRYNKTPVDMYHLMFTACLLCATVLCASALTSLQLDYSSTRLVFGSWPDGLDRYVTLASSDHFAGLSVPAMVLAVATAVGPWVYSKTASGIGDSLGVQASAVVLTVCSALAILLFFVSVKVGRSDSLVFAWSVLIAITAVNCAFTGAVSILHSALHHHLRNRNLPGDADNVLIPSAASVQFCKKTLVRRDTPQGRYAGNAYRILTSTFRDFRDRADAFGVEQHEFKEL